MSARDVAEVDRLNSLRRPQKSGDKKNSVKNEITLSSKKRRPFHSIPPSPPPPWQMGDQTLCAGQWPDTR